MPEKTDRRTKYTKTVLKESILKLMKEKQLSKISIKEICEGADINRTTFYAHYADQYDLLRQIEDEVVSEITNALSEFSNISDTTQTYKMIKRIFEYVAQNGSTCEVLLSDKGDVGFLKRIMMIAEQATHASRTAQGSIDAETAEYLYLYAINGSIGVLQQWLKTGMKKSAKEMANIVTKLTIQLPQVVFK